MSVIDILFRVDEICKKYEKYDVEKQRSTNASPDDAFARLYTSFDSQIDLALQKAEMAARETNRAAAVAMKAEVRRLKARLLEEVPKLQKLALKKVKGISQEELAIRNDIVLALPERIQAIPDGTNDTSAAKSRVRGGLSSSKIITIDSDGPVRSVSDSFFQQSEESSQFRNEYEMRKIKQACNFPHLIPLQHMFLNTSIL
ncbi:unnamed protein product [Cuscuta europaea]|uniref:Syntaxin-71-like n=2 Tax=Cuscuta europaea TaxID=41803 RepID=A0A9P0YRW1_CUSEU|nr:unnamed protein product [Cuscuta europaea]